ncbi:MAG: hypothetical protein ACPHTD_15410 [Gammaproteobacteria bacterium]|jgi:hypothetical protein
MSPVSAQDVALPEYVAQGVAELSVEHLRSLRPVTASINGSDRMVII